MPDYIQTELVKKPGYMLRAVEAWAIYNVIMLLMLVAVLVAASVLHAGSSAWVLIPIIVALIVSEGSIVTWTIGPVIQEWIRQETRVPIKRQPGDPS